MRKVQLSKLGFTLMELMAVVTIIAILAGISLGSYKRSTERALFVEGLTGGHTIAAAIDSYYYEHNFTYPSSMNSLPISLTQSTTTDSSITTKYFTYTLVAATASAPAYVKANRIGGNYYIAVYLETTMAGSDKANYLDRCVGSNTEGQNFCASVGYSCTVNGNTGSQCIKNT